MKQDEFRRQLAAATPDMPEQYVQCVEVTLEKIAAKEMSKPKKPSLSKRTMVIVIALIIVLMGLTAYALTQWKIFEQLADVVGKNVPEEADKLMQSNLHRQTINGVEITIQEAGYDGRTLLLQYSYRFPDIEEPLGVTAAEYYRGDVPKGISTDSIVGLKEDATVLMTDYGVNWWTDAFRINGESISMPSGSGSIDVGSTVNGEIIHTEYWRLDNENVYLDGVVEITLPIGKQEDGGFTFTFDTQGVQNQVITAQEKYHAELSSFSATVTEATFTPLMAYITLAYEKTNAAQYTDDNWPFGIGNECLAWIYSLQLVDGQGEPIFSTDYTAESVSETEAQFYLPYVSVAAYDELWLAPIDNGKGNLSQAIRIW